MKEHNWIKVILTPLSWIYGSVTSLRNLMYDRQVFKSYKPSQFTISVGNLTVGGTGKTPVTEYLVRLLSGKLKVAVLSRGYGRKTRGFLLADHQSAAADIGDEPLQYFEKFGDKVVVAVSENRGKGAGFIQTLHPETRLIVLDDAYQHRAIEQNIKLLLNDYNRPFYRDLPFPAGRLRETRSGAKRADAVIVTKSPVSLTENDKDQITANIRRYSGRDTPVFFSAVRYGDPVSYSGLPVALKNVKLAAGIANPSTFIAYMKQRFNVMEEIIFPDHHNYSIADLEGLIKYLKNDTFVVTTEKDMVKLKPLAEVAGVITRFAYIPIAVDFGKDTSRFNQWILQQIP
jgi:tetraacyldisaccharide 4'-kinase